MHTQTKKEPAVSVVLIGGNSHALTVVVGNRPAVLARIIFFKLLDYLLAVCSEIVTLD